MSLTVTDEGVARELSDGRTESVTWDELRQVLVITTSAGPFGEDVYYILDGGENGVVVAQSQMTEDLLTRLQALPGFDNDTLIEAMASTCDADFLIWERDG